MEQRPAVLELLSRLRRNPLECWSAEFFCEPIIQIKLPLLNSYVLNEPEAIRCVLMENTENYRKDPIQRRILSSGLADGLLVNSFTAAMLSAAEQLAARWTKLGGGAILDVAAEMTLITLNVLALTIFSDRLGGDLDEFRSAMNDYFGVIGRIGALDLLGVPPAVPRPGRARLRRTTR